MKTKRLRNGAFSLAISVALFISGFGGLPVFAAGSHYIWIGGGNSYKKSDRTYIDRPTILGKGESVSADYHDTNTKSGDGKVTYYGYYMGFAGVNDSLVSTTKRTVEYKADAQGTKRIVTGTDSFTITGDDPVLIRANSSGDVEQVVEYNSAGEPERGIDTHYSFYEFGLSMESLGGSAFSVTYDLNGGAWGNGSNHPASFPVTEKDTIYTLDIPVRQGYKFAGWNNIAGDAIRGVEGSSVKVWGYKDTGSADGWWNQAKKEMASGITLTANWEDGSGQDDSGQGTSSGSDSGQDGSGQGTSSESGSGQDGGNKDKASGTQKQTIKVKVASKTLKASDLKKKAISFSIGAKAKTSLTYKVIQTPSRASKFISVSKKGKVKIKKGAKKGTYKIRITAAASGKYKKATKTIKIKVS